jgi:hypothetical protein
MNKISLILIGTTHETDAENILFDKLNDIEKYKNVLWLCEGESGARKCISMKDYRIHLLSDTLFVNMMIIDMNAIKTKHDAYFEKEYTNTFIERIVELFITILNSEICNEIIQDNTLLLKCIGPFKDNKDINYKMYDNIYLYLKNIHIDVLKKELRLIIDKIIKLILKKKLIDTQYNKCIIDFYKSGTVCEDTIMVLLRQKVFIHKILTYVFYMIVNNIKNGKIIVTIGSYHINGIYNYMKKYNDNIKISLYTLK